MGRTTQIISIIALLLIGISAHAQKSPKQGVRAYPVYYLQGLEFEQDSTVIGLYSWIDPRDRAAVLGGDTSVVVLVLDTLAHLPDVEVMEESDLDSTLIIEANQKADSVLILEQMALDSIYSYERFDQDEDLDFIPEWEGIDSAEFNGRTEVLADSLIDPLEGEDESIEEIVPKDTLLQVVDSLLIPVLDNSAIDTVTIDPIELPAVQSMVDSIGSDSLAYELPLVIDSIPVDSIASESLLDTLSMDSLHIDQPSDSISMPTEDLNLIEVDSMEMGAITPLELDEKDIITTDSTMSSGQILIKSDPDILGNSSIERPVLQITPTRRSLSLSEEKADINEPIARRENRTISTRVDSVIIERVIERPVATKSRDDNRPKTEYTGEYAGLSKSERERQLRLDAENARKIERERLELEKRRLEMEIAKLSLQQQVDPVSSDSLNTSVTQSAGMDDSEARAEVTAPVRTIVIEKTPDPVVVVQRDTLTEIALERMSKRITEIAIMDSAEKKRQENERQLEKQLIEGRFDRIESKMDTLLDALGKKHVMPAVELNAPLDEMNVYFAVNSTKISRAQLQSISTFISSSIEQGSIKVILSGHADSSGDLGYNKMLAQKRCESVQQAILQLNVEPREVLIRSFGEEGADTSQVYNQLDRRVTIQVMRTP